jgi:hypothetical protein
MENIVIEKSFVVPIWDELVKQKAITYWQRKRFKFTQTSGDTLFAKRGRWLGNMISADLTYMKAELSIKTASNAISCVMEVNTRFQKISEWDLMWWRLEMKTFESFLLQDDEQPELWNQFKKDHKNVVLAYGFSGGKDTSLLKMAPEDKARYE